MTTDVNANHFHLPRLIVNCDILDLMRMSDSSPVAREFVRVLP